MPRRAFTLVVVFLVVLGATAQAQVQPTSPGPIPAAVRSQAECTGFIAKPSVPRDLFVVGGADDDLHSVVRQFAEGQSIFISSQKGGEVTVGTEYRVVRPAKELFLTRHYTLQGWDISKLGKPYEDVAIVRVTHTNPQGAVALVTFSCGPILPGDTVTAFQPRAIPEYTVSKPLDHFLPLDENKRHGRITAARNNYSNLGNEFVLYLNLGEKDGATLGQRFRIYKLLPPHPTGFLTRHRTPPETIGEAVVLSVQSESCVAMVVASYREITVGDYVEAE